MNVHHRQMAAAFRQHAAHGREILDRFSKDQLLYSQDFTIWRHGCEATIESVYGVASEALRSFKSIRFLPPDPNASADTGQERLLWFDNGLRMATNVLDGYAYSLERLAPANDSRNKNVFISHGGNTVRHVDAVSDLLTALGMYPVVVMRMPNLNNSVNGKVVAWMGICQAAVVLATVEDETVAAERRCRPNVENEVGMLQLSSNIGGRIVYLKEDGVQFASNYAEKVWIPFDKKYVQNAFTALVRDLRAFGLVM